MKNVANNGRSAAINFRMGRDSLLIFRPVAWTVVCLGLSATSTPAATVEGNPYSAIVVRNAFGLKPLPNPADLIKTPEPVSADIKLQGITTILGRAQVLLSVKPPAQPGKAVSEQSLMLNEGQREGDVEVLSINAAQRTVSLKNGGTSLTLNMKDDAEKPVPGASIPTAVHPLGRGIPGVLPAIPGHPTVPAVGSAGGGTTTFGGSSAQNISAFGSTPTAGAAAGARLKLICLREPYARPLPTGSAPPLRRANTAMFHPRLKPS